MFAIDYLSWDEANPSRRAAALAPYLPKGARANPEWSRHGRQRATFAVPGAAKSRGATTLIDVRVHVSPFERVRGRATSDVDEAPVAITSAPKQRAAGGRSRPSSAPAPDAEEWTALDAEWVRLPVPVRRLETGQLVIDPDAWNRAQTLNRRSE